MANLPKVVTCKRKVVIKPSSIILLVKPFIQGCGKCLYCLKIMVLCECSEKDKVQGTEMNKNLR